jgi:hypothetical protein
MGKSAGCPAFLPVGRGGEESRPCNHIYITRKLPPSYVGGELHFPVYGEKRMRGFSRQQECAICGPGCRSTGAFG